jgi:hypothetical protein
VLSTINTTYTATTTGMVTFELHNWKDGAYDPDLINYADHVRMYPQNPNFIALQHEIDINVGGTATFMLDAGAAYANKYSIILQSITGNHPGFDMNGNHIPLNMDVWSWMALDFTLQGFWSGFYGPLDANGQSTAVFNTFGAQPAAYGLIINFAYMVLQNPTNTPVFASYPIYVLMR